MYLTKYEVYGVGISQYLTIQFISILGVMIWLKIGFFHF